LSELGGFRRQPHNQDTISCCFDRSGNGEKFPED
jgi:hypothetical protein